MTGRVRTVPPEARAYQGHRAGVVSRVLAAVIDSALVLAMLAAAYAVWAGALFVLSPRDFDFPRPSALLDLICWWLIATGYLTVTWAVTGRSYGKQVMGLRAVGSSGGPLGPLVALGRAAACVTFPAGLFWVAVSRQNRSVQDLLLRTSVIYDWEDRPSR